MGIYNTIQIEFLKTELTEVRENSRQLFEIADIQEHQLRQVEISINIIATQLIQNLQNDPALYDSRLTRVENQIRDRLRATTHALQAASKTACPLTICPQISLKGCSRNSRKQPQTLTVNCSQSFHRTYINWKLHCCTTGSTHIYYCTSR